MQAINRFLLQNHITIRDNPCISPDFCLDWERFSRRLRDDPALATFTVHDNSRLDIAAGLLTLVEDDAGEHAWILDTPDTARHADLLDGGSTIGDTRVAFPAIWENLLRLKNLIQEHARRESAS